MMKSLFSRLFLTLLIFFILFVSPNVRGGDFSSEFKNFGKQLADSLGEFEEFKDLNLPCFQDMVSRTQVIVKEKVWMDLDPNKIYFLEQEGDQKRWVQTSCAHPEVTVELLSFPENLVEKAAINCFLEPEPFIFLSRSNWEAFGFDREVKLILVFHEYYQLMVKSAVLLASGAESSGGGGDGFEAEFMNIGRFISGVLFSRDVVERVPVVLDEFLAEVFRLDVREGRPTILLNERRWREISKSEYDQKIEIVSKAYQKAAKELEGIEVSGSLSSSPDDHYEVSGILFQIVFSDRFSNSETLLEDGKEKLKSHPFDKYYKSLEPYMIPDFSWALVKAFVLRKSLESK